MMKVFLCLTAVICMGLLSACSSERGVIKAHFSCMYVASQLDKPEAAAIVARKMKDYAVQNNIPPLSDREMMFLRDEVVNDDLQIHRYGVEALVNEYNSSKCMKLHEQEKFDVEKELQSVW
ncbi:MAG: hypothetical protein Q3971_02585 [Moraxella sp.]|nr:hypothetical protein [Moraxella sp.]